MHFTLLFKLYFIDNVREVNFGGWSKGAKLLSKQKVATLKDLNETKNKVSLI